MLESRNWNAGMTSATLLLVRYVCICKSLALFPKDGTKSTSQMKMLSVVAYRVAIFRSILMG
eukprot:420130-Amorphochlora_amoeboformis.AAC.3